MSDLTEAERDACDCTTIGADDPGTVRQCGRCFRIFGGDKRLTSVRRVIKAVWPFPPDFSKADPEVLERARDRGSLVDHLFSAHVNGTPLFIPKGTRKDEDFTAESVDLFRKVKTWFDERYPPLTAVRAQVLLANDEIAGVCDLILNGGVWELKTVSKIEATYALQVGIYGVLYEHQYGRPPDALGIIHVNKSMARPKIINLDVKSTMADARTVLAMFELIQRRTK